MLDRLYFLVGISTLPKERCTTLQILMQSRRGQGANEAVELIPVAVRSIDTANTILKRLGHYYIRLIYLESLV